MSWYGSRLWGLVSIWVAGCGMHTCFSAVPQSGYGRAVVLTDAIQRDYWDGDRRAYLDVIPRRTDGLPYAMMWPNGVQFTVLASASRHARESHAADMKAFFEGLEQFWNPRRRLYSAYFGGTEDVYYDDNQWMILAFVEAYEVTGDRAYLNKAHVLAEACLAGVDGVAGGGSFWHVDTQKNPSKNTCSNAPLATALLRVRRHLTQADDRDRYLQQARKILEWTRDTLQDDRGLMLDNIDTSTGKITRWTFTYNTALMIQGWLELHLATGDPAALAEAERLAEASDHWLKPHGPNPNDRHYDDAVYFVVHLVEALARLAEFTGDRSRLPDCRRTADFYYHKWQQGAAPKLLDAAAVARLQWLTGDPGEAEFVPVADRGVGARLEPVTVGPDGRSFVGVKSGRRFVAWGCNYDHDESGRLLEEYWAGEWDTVEEDFAEMGELGINVVRIHLQLGRFMRGPDEPDAAALARLARLVELAEATGLYLDVTGLGCYHKDEVPTWYDELAEQERWRVQAGFWEAVAGICAPSPAIFCYDLMNEPILPGAREDATEWLAGEFGGKFFVQRIALALQGRSRENVARAWVETMVSAIRRQDPEHMITVGVIPWALPFPKAKPVFYAPAVAANLDFVSVHFYPKSGEIDKALAALQVYDIGKPLVIEEMFPLACSPEEMCEFIDGSRDIVDGWISFYWGRTAAEYAGEDSLAAALKRSWLECFRAKGVEILSESEMENR